MTFTGSARRKRDFVRWAGEGQSVGHLDTAAGITGFIKTVLCLHHGEIRRSPRRDGESRCADRGQSVLFQPAAAGLATPARRTLCCRQLLRHRRHQRPHGARGDHGTSVVGPGCSPPPSQLALIPLSAKNRDRLDAVVAALLATITVQTAKAPLNLHDVAFTLQVGRASLEERLGLTAATLEELAAKLRLVQEGREAEAGCLRGTVKRRKSASDQQGQPPIERVCSRAGSRVKDVDWAALHEGVARRRVHLPSYPFAGERYPGSRGAAAAMRRWSAR